MRKTPATLAISTGILILFPSLTMSQWISVNSGPGGNSSLCVWSLAVSGNHVVAGTDNGIFLSANNGSSWTATNSSLTNAPVYSLAVSDSIVFAGTKGGIFASDNYGTSWTLVDSSLNSVSVSSFAVSGSNIFAGTNGGVFRSTNNGMSWTAVDSGLSNTHVWSLAASGANLFAGTSGGVFLSTNNGMSWTPVDSGLLNSGQYSRRTADNVNTAVWSLAESGGTIFAGTDGGGVFLSSNNGANWIPVNSGLLNQRAGSLYVWRLAVIGSNIFAGTDGDGIFLSTTNGASWTGVNTGLLAGLTNATVLSFAVSGGKVFAGTCGGLYYRPLSEMAGVIAPGPHVGTQSDTGFKPTVSARFNSNTAVGFSLSKAEPVTVKIYSLTGRETTSLVDKHLGPGLHSYGWDMKNMACGCYMVRVQAGTNTFAKSVSIVR